ncbi:hypothetical protein AWW72_13345 [Acinetobacter sp. NRRL B-65365]|nr:hypothetical protein AWW72_13345 [Acinetobacter sp. NRRL B-65365]
MMLDREAIFSDENTSNMFSVPSHDESNALEGVRMVYCADVADYLDKPLQAKKLYEKGLLFMDKYVESISRFSLEHKEPDILDFYKPRYIKDKEIIKGMILQKTLERANLDINPTPSMVEKIKQELKNFYSDSCSDYL